MKKEKTLSSMEVRIKNRNRVFRCLLENETPLTKQELATKLAMSMPTLKQNLQELHHQGLIDDSATTVSTGGRKPKLISLVPSAKYSLGIEITSSEIWMVAIDLRSNILAKQVSAMPFSNTAEYGVGLTKNINVFLQEKGLEKDKLLGVGLSLPGIISQDKGSIDYAPTLKILKPEKNLFCEQIPYPTMVENDATCGGFAEWCKIKDAGNAAYLSLGVGVGGAILINGNAYEGNTHRSAEFGHMCIHPKGKNCSCGRRGCMEAYCSSRCISDEIGTTVAEFFQGARTGNLLYQTLLDNYLSDLVLALNNIIIMLDCDVIIGGRLSEELAQYQEDIEHRVNENNTLTNHHRIRFCNDHAFSIGLGAAMQFVAKYIKTI